MLMHFSFFYINNTYAFTIIFVIAGGIGILCISITNTCKHIHNSNATLIIANDRCRRTYLSVSAILKANIRNVAAR
uniref:Putative secreted protein n=1 Tax=Xenopsylla cheopis TaxID=163159 RepID=A0A6M2E0Z4_XENCH